MPRAGMQQAEGEFTFIGGEGINRYIGVGTADWFRLLPPPNRTSGFPASGSPVGGSPARAGLTETGMGCDQ
jgi:hypothetical protein